MGGQDVLGEEMSVGYLEQCAHRKQQEVQRKFPKKVGSPWPLPHPPPTPSSAPGS